MASCPVCGRGQLFDGLLKFREQCDACGADFGEIEDTGDGPAVFVIFAVGIFIVPIPVILSVALGWPMWAALAVGIPLITLVSIGLLRRFRAALFAQQWRKQAREERFRPQQPADSSQKR